MRSSIETTDVSRASEQEGVKGVASVSGVVSSASQTTIMGFVVTSFFWF